MMTKKRYITPQVEQEVVDTHEQILSGSVTGGSILDESAGTDVDGLAPGFFELEILDNTLIESYVLAL